MLRESSLVALMHRLGWLVLLVFSFSAGLWLRGAGPTRHIYLGGRLPPCPRLQSQPRAEVWFPRLGLFFDAQGRLWQRDLNGFVLQVPDANARYRARITQDGLVTLEMSLTSWQNPGPCTVRFSLPGAATRLARNVELSGPWRTLSGRFGELPPAQPLRAED